MTKESKSKTTPIDTKLPTSTTTGEPTKPAKGIGKVSYHEDDEDSQEDSPWTLSFNYFRTKSGLPPKVEARRYPNGFPEDESEKQPLSSEDRKKLDEAQKR